MLLHVCCAPCSTAAVERLGADYQVTAFFYNPNIHPKEEHDLRLGEMERLAEALGIPFMPAAYDDAEWFALIKGHEDAPEGGPRCDICYLMRLERTAAVAREEQFPFFTTTLSISPHKQAAVINCAGRAAAERHGVSFLELDLKKRGGFARSIHLSKQHHLHRQDYCGCIFSLRERTLRR